MFSIIIPSYNSSGYIKNALDSIAGQTVGVSKVEVIIVDDNSKDIDNLEKIVSLYKLSYDIKLIRNIKKVNAAVSRNLGIKKARYDIICLLDADDYWDETKLQTGLDLLEKQYNKHTVIYTRLRRGTHYQIQSGLAEVIPRHEKGNSRALSDYWFIDKGITQTSSLIYRKSAFKDILFNEKLNRHQDYDFCLKLESHGAEFKLDDKSFTNWVILDENIDAVKKGANLEFCKRWLCDYSAYLTEESKNYYIARNMLLISLKNKEFLSWLKFLMAQNFKHIPKILYLSTSLILQKVFLMIFKK
ncbi:glycosyltransferase family 2 protein [Pseudoalteromonas sp. NZS71_1]|uniref:glycosyltransferase family 2 protein n=1 Tax=Pseudoalteromonas sp. NZS71_1 TaxID=2792072 RepID=UPI0018CF0058|nr:glycosyltransferase family 2 protein [Pseudoalteromonas sp. NZS71_1]MBH0036790.1 glycosyltransferase family 2 protein [Pseudoalteromonas sp. NZS71_1]